MTSLEGRGGSFDLDPYVIPQEVVFDALDLIRDEERVEIAEQAETEIAEYHSVAEETSHLGAAIIEIGQGKSTKRGKTRKNNLVKINAGTASESRNYREAVAASKAVHPSTRNVKVSDDRHTYRSTAERQIPVIDEGIDPEEYERNHHDEEILPDYKYAFSDNRD